MGPDGGVCVCVVCVCVCVLWEGRCTKKGFRETEYSWNETKGKTNLEKKNNQIKIKSKRRKRRKLKKGRLDH